MALLNFPSPSSIGEQTTQNGNTWQWNGTSWVAFNNLSLSSQVTGILAVQYGGTGFGGTYTKGDLLYASSSNTFTKLAAGTAGSVLASSGPGGDLYWKLDAQGAGTVSTGTANEITYYDTTTSVNSATGITLVAGTKLTIGLGTSSTSTTTGAFIVYGGVGIGGSLWTNSTNYSSISGVGHQNGAITSGIWSGTAISLSNGGTNGTRSGTAVSYELAVYNSTGTAITQIETASSIANSILLQTTQLAYPTWVGQSQLVVGAATSAAQVNTEATTSTRYLIGTANNTASASAQLSTGSGITIGDNRLTSGAIAVTFNTGTAVTTGGALIVAGGVGIGGSLWTTASNFSSISGVGHQNGAITSGVWSGTAISTSKGGTGLITVNANEVLIGASTGNTWTAIGSTYLPVVGIGSNPPTQPGGAIGATQAGQLWWDSQYGVLKIFYVDGTPTPPGQWVDATPVLGSSGGGSSSKRSYVMSFGAGFTPSTGADTVSIQVPYAPDNSSQYYYIKRLDYRHETAGTGVQFYIERHNTGNASFSPSVRIHTAGSGTGASFVTTGAGIFITSYTLSSTGASFVSSSGVAGSVVSGDYLRLNFTAINSAANMSISMVLEEQ